MVPTQQFGPLVVCSLLAIAAASDVASRRIPNALVVSIGVLGFASSTVVRGGIGLASALAASILTGGLLMFAWRRRALGGGDVKLAAAAAACVGFAGLPRFALGTAAFGGVVAALSWAVAHAVRAGRIEAPIRVPYGAAIAFGAAFVLVVR